MAAIIAASGGPCNELSDIGLVDRANFWGGAFWVGRGQAKVEITLGN
jgi:hypothetical protein